MMGFLTSVWLSLPASAGVIEGTHHAQLDAVYAPKRVAVLIGVQDYADPKLQGLRYPAKDAHDLGLVLGDDQNGSFDRVIIIEGAAATTAAAIEHTIAVATADLQRDDTFLLYLSGHGTLTLDPLEGSRLWFLPSDGELDHPETTGIAISKLEEQVNALSARRRVLVLDTCHNGRARGELAGRAVLNDSTQALMQGFRGEPPAPRTLREVSESEARLFAAQYHQPAMEDPELENGVYTHFLINALTTDSDEADLDRDGLVDVAEAHDFARDRTMQHTGGIQVPRAEYRIVGREEIYLAGNPLERSAAEQALLSACDQLLAQARLLVDGIPRGEFPGLLAVQPGRHHIEIQTADGRSLMRRKVTLEAGHTLPVESLFTARVPSWLFSLGAKAHHGHGWANHLPFAVEGEISLIDPFQTVHWLRPELHLRASGMMGQIPEQGDYPVTIGDVSLGTSLGWYRRNLSLGPELELMVPWRHFENETGQHRQATATLAAGGRALWLLPLENRALAFRYDIRFAPYQHDSVWTSLWHHGFAIGLGP